MKNDNMAFPYQFDDVSRYQWSERGLTKFEYACIEFMKASICANNQTAPHYIDSDQAKAHAKVAILYTNALFQELENEVGNEKT